MSLNSAFDLVSSFVGTLVLAGGGGAVIAMAVFRTLAEKWLQSRFDASADVLRHQNAKELEAIRTDLNGQLDSRIRVQQREFEVLSDLWAKATRSFGLVSDYCNPTQFINDISRVGAERRREIFEICKFSSADIADVEQASNPQERFRELWLRTKGDRAREAQREFNNFLLLNEIFIAEDLFVRFKILSDELHAAVSERTFASDPDHPQPTDLWNRAWQRVDTSARQQMLGIAAEARARFTSRP